MLFPGTEMHIITFGFICFEIILLIHLTAYKLARPVNKTFTLDICLLTILIVYNLCGGLLPDPDLPGSYIIQECIAYGTGFLAPAFFPYYVWKGFGLEQMRFHTLRGIHYFLLIPYIVFAIVLTLTQDLEIAEYVLAIPMLYGIWILKEVIQNIHIKYNNSLSDKAVIEEILILIFCLTPWVCLPIITYYDFPQYLEVAVTNSGFLMLLALHVKQAIIQMRKDYKNFTNSKAELDLKETLEPDIIEKERNEITLDQKIQTNSNKYPLTNREKQIALLLCKGYSHQQIADSLCISPRTVGKHVQNIFDKLSIASRYELILKLTV